MTTTAPTNPYPDVALPPGADPNDVDNWETGSDGVASRLVWSFPSQIEGLDVRIVACQRPDGSIVSDDLYEGPQVYIGNDDYSPADARLLAAALIAAADLADKWVTR